MRFFTRRASNTTGAPLALATGSPIGENTAGNRSPLAEIFNGIPALPARGGFDIRYELDRRHRRHRYICLAVNYTGGTGQATTIVSGTAGSGLTITPTIVNGQITAGAVVAGGTGYGSNSVVTVVDATGQGATFSVTQSGGVVSAVTVVSGGTASPISPMKFFDQTVPPVFKVGSTIMRDVSVDTIMRLAMCCGSSQGRYQVPLGHFVVDYVEPNRDTLIHNDDTAWQMQGQAGPFTVTLQLAPNLVNPSITCVEEYDKMLTGAKVNGTMSYYVNPIGMHERVIPVTAPFTDYQLLPVQLPMQRLFIVGSSPGNISRLSFTVDNILRWDMFIAQWNEMLNAYGFWFGEPGYLDRNYSSNTALSQVYEQPLAWDTAILPDVDKRLDDVLRFASVNSPTNLRIYTAVNQTVKLSWQTQPRSFATS